ncbi:MAG: phage portal protein [Beijerinckiaceae bacterium]
MAKKMSGEPQARALRVKSAPDQVAMNAGWDSLSSLLGIGSGIIRRINEIDALCQSAVAAATDVISQDIAKARLRLVRDIRGSIKVVEPTEHDIAKRLALDPNEHQTWHEVVEMLVRSLALHQNAFVVTRRRTLTDLNPPWVPVNVNRVNRQTDQGRSSFLYDVTPASNAESVLLGWVGTRRLTSDEVIHLIGRTVTGDIGLSTLTLGADLFGLSAALSDFQRGMAANGLRPNAVITTDHALTDSQFARLKTQIQEMIDGAISKGKPAVLDNGLKYETIAMDAIKSDLVRAKGLIRQEIASIFRIPGYKIGAGDQDSKYSNREQAEATYVDECLLHVALRTEAILTKFFLTDAERLSGLRFDFSRDDLYDRDRQMASDRIVKQYAEGIITRGQAVSKLGYPPVDPHLDTYRVPVNSAILHGTGEIEAVTSGGPQEAAPAAAEKAASPINVTVKTPEAAAPAPIHITLPKPGNKLILPKRQEDGSMGFEVTEKH